MIFPRIWCEDNDKPDNAQFYLSVTVAIIIIVVYIWDS